MRAPQLEGSHLAHLKPQSNTPSTSATSDSFLSVSLDLWNILIGELEDFGGDKILIAVESRFGTNLGVKGLKSLIIWAKKLDLVEVKGITLEPFTVVVPPTLLVSHRNIFGRPRPASETPLPSLLISTIQQPTPLSSLILISHDLESYEVKNLEELIEKECEVIREGELLSISLDCDIGEESRKRKRRWRVAMTEPVLQGIVQKGFTQFLVLPPSHSELEGIEYEDVEEIEYEEEEEDYGEEEEIPIELEEDFDIDESFLTTSVISPSSVNQSPITSPTSQLNSLALVETEIKSSSTHHLLIEAHPLTQTIPSQLLIPRPEEGDDEIPRVYLKMRDLGKLGMFSGDWVIVSPAEKGYNDDSRLVRVFACDGIVVEEENSTFSSTIQALFPPTFLHNFLPFSSTNRSIIFSPITSSPTFPTANSVTVARIASPYSVHRTYQPLFLSALKDYFQGKKRILKEKDIIAVGICEDGARFGLNAIGEDDEIDLPISSGGSTAVVFFQITSLDLISSPTQSQTKVNKFKTSGRNGEEIFLEELEIGSFGCFVDPKITKMVQSGLERSLVPDVAGFLNLSESNDINRKTTNLGEPTPSGRLVEYVKASLRAGSSEYDLHLTVLLKGARGCGKRTIVRNVARSTGFHLLELDCFDLIGETELKTEGHLKSRIDKAVSCSPCILLLRNIEALARKSQALETGQEPAMSTILKECFTIARQGWKSSGFPIIVIGTTCDIDKIPTGVLGAFKEEISYEAPGESERLQILQSLTISDIVAPDVSLRALSIQTAALVATDLVDLVRRARSSATARILFTSPNQRIKDLQFAGIALTSIDFNLALEKARSSYSESIGAPKIPSVRWEDVGGLANVKSDILDTIQLPLEHPELFADGLKKRSGILLYGPPGTGKTLLAKAVATSCSLNFFSIKGPELLNMYIGESEANVRRVFQRARDAKPCVIFFDELDSVAPKRGNQGDSGGVMDRIVSQLLAELDGMAEGKGGSDVFVIGATNRPDLLDPALLRPGRFDRMLYLGVSDNHDSQLKIIQALTRKFKLDPNINLEAIANLCPFNYTGADFYALCSDAMLKAMTRKADQVDKKIADLNTRSPYLILPLTPQYYLAELASPTEMEVLVSQIDFEESLKELVPSVSKAEMLHYKTVQQRFSGETMNSEEKLNEKLLQQKQLELPLPEMNGNSKNKGKGKEKN